MSTAIYLSNNIIRVISGTRTRGKVKVKQEFSHAMSEGNLINGVITNSQGLESEIEALWKEHKLPRKNVYLVVHSSKVVSKQLTLPKLKEKKLTLMVPMEFTEVARYEDAIYDYMKMPGAEKVGMQDLLGVVTERSFVEEYITLFSHLGIKIAGVSNATGAMIKTLHYLEFLLNKTCIVQAVDGYALESILWVNGKFVYSTSRRLIAEKGSVGFYTEVLRHTSSIMQFFSSMKREEQISEVYICGMTAAEIDQLSSLEKEFQLGLDILPLDLSREVKGIKSIENLEDDIYAFGALIKGKKDINLLKVYKKNPELDRIRKRRVQRLVPIVLLTMAGTAVTGKQWEIYQDSKLLLESLNIYITNPVNMQTALEVDVLTAEIELNRTAISEADMTADMIRSYPLMNQKVNDIISQVTEEGVTAEITGYNANDGMLRMKAKAITEQAISEYITALYNTTLFENIEYTGYTYVETESIYSINVVCYLAENAGR